ncbi:MAG: M20/M25/M40 family metallo-hydrolase [Dehalococcoidia bacterium]|nr:M20/M25/M40 family metallo-hydrolase [Dehalococcoidia bacterium]
MEVKKMNDLPIDLLCRYIRLDTSNPPGNEHLATVFFEQMLKSEGIDCKTYEAKPGRTSIRAEIKGSGRKQPVIMLHHTDVIAANHDEWSFDPFGGEIIDGYICGRGALDTKSLGIMQLLAMIDIKNQNRTPDCDLIFLATADEESGASYGVDFLLHKYPDDFKAGLLLNEGSYVQSGAVREHLAVMISPGEKGACWLRLKRKGTPGHGSTPHSQNPLEKLTSAVKRLLDSKAEISITPIVRDYFRKIALAQDFLKPYADDGKDETLLQIVRDFSLLDNPHINAMLSNTISLNSLHAGTKINVIPSYAEAEIDTRVLPGQRVDEWVNHIKDQLADEDIQIEFITRGEGNASDYNTESYRLIEKTLEKHYPGSITTPYLMLGTTDSRFFRQKGIPSYGFCPAVVPVEHLKSLHGIDEKIGVDSMLKGTEVYSDIIGKLCIE